MSAIRSLAHFSIQTCRVLAPVAIECTSLVVLRRLKIPFGQSLLVGTACGIGALWLRLNKKTSTLEKIATAAIYTALKALQVYNMRKAIQSDATQNNRGALGGNHLRLLQLQFLIPENEPIYVGAIQHQWKLNSTFEATSALLDKAIDDLDGLYDDLRAETHVREDHRQLSAMATLLEHEEKYRNRFLNPAARPLQEPVQLLTFYRFVRGQGYSVGARPGFSTTWDEKSANLFFESEPHKTWREKYNQAIKKWEPVIKYLPPDSLLRQWAVEDRNVTPAPDSWAIDIFKLQPRIV